MIKLLDLPLNIKGFTVHVVEPDGEYDTIILNSRYTDLKDTYEHEMYHIMHDDFQGGNVADIENDNEK